MTGYQTCSGGGGGDGSYECYMGHFTGQVLSEREVSGAMLGNKNNQEVPYFDITDFVDVDGSVKGIDPGTNLLGVSVNGMPFSGDGNSDKDKCNPSVQPADGRYRTRLINSNTLRLCYNENSQRLGRGGAPQGLGAEPGGEPTKTFGGVPADHYLFDASRSGCSTGGTEAQQQLLPLCAGRRHLGPNGSDERQNFANWYSSTARATSRRRAVPRWPSRSSAPGFAWHGRRSTPATTRPMTSWSRPAARAGWASSAAMRSRPSATARASSARTSTTGCSGCPPRATRRCARP